MVSNMPVQMYLNQGPQDQLLFCNDRSFFTNTGYTCTTNFQLEYRDVDPVSTAKLGGTARFVLPKAADLLGHVDLLADVKKATGGCTATNSAGADLGDAEGSAWYWVNKLGFAMIEKVTMSIGSNMIEEITGEQLDLINELMRDGKDKFGWHHIMRDAKPAGHHIGGRGAFTINDLYQGKEGLSASGEHANGGTLVESRGHYSRFIGGTNDSDGSTAVRNSAEHKLIVPLGLFFTKHPSQYFPLGAIAGCNDIVLEVKFRPLAHLIGYTFNNSLASGAVLSAPTFTDEAVQNIKLRCTYVHLTGPEAALQMNKEHVRLMRQWKNLNFTKSIGTTTGATNWSVDLSFLHPVSFLVITFRKSSHLESGATNDKNDKDAAEKGFYNYYGSGKNPNLDFHPGSASKVDVLKVKDISLTLNGQERHPGLTANKLDHHYLKHRVMPQLFSSSDYHEEHLCHHATAPSGVTSTATVTSDAIKTGGDDATTTVAVVNNVSEADVRHELQAHRQELLGAKDIYIYPFSIHPEGANPSGSVNFSKVSHAKLTANVEVAASGSTTPEWRMDVYAVGYNWLQIKDGRGLLSFA